MTIHCRVIACLPADTSRDFVTLTIDLLTLKSCYAWKIQLSTLLPSLKTLRLSVLDLWVITLPVGYHWKCVRGNCACAVSRDPCVGSQKQLHFSYAGPRFAHSLCNFVGSTMKVIKVICENNARPCDKWRMSFGACTKSRDLLNVPEMSYCIRTRRHRFTVLDFKIWAYSRIYGHFQQHLRSIRRPDFLLECKISAIWRRFPLIFAFYILNVRHISTSALFDLLT